MEKTGIEQYQAVIFQPMLYAAETRADIRKNINHFYDMIDFVCNRDKTTFGEQASIKLLVFPEMALCGGNYPLGLKGRRRSLKEGLEVSIEIPGPETDLISQKSIEHGVYICCGCFEKDSKYPNIHFNSAFITNPQGKIILKYRKINSTNNMLELCQSPHSILDIYKEDPLPVASTKIGKLAVGICYDLEFPELWRAYALKGAEIFLHPNGGMSDYRIAQARARAIDNMAYFLSANMGPFINSGGMTGGMGKSIAIDFMGNVIAETSESGEQMAYVPINLRALRAARSQRWFNRLAHITAEIYKGIYDKPLWPKNTCIDCPVPETLADVWKHGDKAVENLMERFKETQYCYVE